MTVIVEGGSIVRTVDAGSVMPGWVVVTNRVVSSVVVHVPAGIDDRETERAVNVINAVLVAVAVS